MWIDEVGGVEARAAGFALVTVGSFAAAMGASAHHIAVGEELAGLLIVGLQGCFLYEFAVVIQAAEKFACCVAMYIGGGAGVNVKRYSQSFH